MVNEFRSIAKKLQADFERSEQVQHQGLKGVSREHALVDGFLTDHLPTKYSVGSGEILDSSGYVSKQQDIIVYDGYNIPVLQKLGETTVFFAEQVYTIIEVKSTLGHGEIKDVIEKGKSVHTLQRAGLADRLRIPVFGFAYRSKMSLEQIRDYSQKQADHFDGGWGISAIVVLSDANGKTGLITNVDTYYPAAIRLFSGQADPVVSIATKSEGETLLVFHLLLLEAIKLVEASSVPPSYLAYAHSGGLGTMDITLGTLGASYLAYQKPLSLLKNAHNLSDREVIQAWRAFLMFVERNGGSPINDGEYFAIEGQFAGGPTTREVWDAVERYAAQGEAVVGDEERVQFLVSTLRRVARENTFVDFVHAPKQAT